MKISDIIVSVNNILKNEFELSVYSKETSEIQDRPCFYVDLIPNSFTQYAKHWNENSIQIMITYLDTKRDDEELYGIIEKMKSLFLKRLKVNERYLKITSFDYDFVGADDSLIEFTIDVDYMEYEEGKISEDIIQELNLDIKGE